MANSAGQALQDLGRAIGGCGCMLGCLGVLVILAGLGVGALALVVAGAG